MSHLIPVTVKITKSDQSVISNKDKFNMPSHMQTVHGKITFTKEREPFAPKVAFLLTPGL